MEKQENKTTKKNNFIKLMDLFFTFFYIGLTTFGGGYVMLVILEEEIVKGKKWISKDEMTNLIAISESTPGPFAMNAATFIGKKRAGIIGSFMACLGVVLPSFLIILALSFLYKEFLNNIYVQAFLKGAKVGVVILLVKAGIIVKNKAYKFKFSNLFILISFVLAVFTSISLILLLVLFLYLYIILRKVNFTNYDSTV